MWRCQKGWAWGESVRWCPPRLSVRNRAASISSSVSTSRCCSSCSRRSAGTAAGSNCTLWPGSKFCSCRQVWLASSCRRWPRSCCRAGAREWPLRSTPATCQHRSRRALIWASRLSLGGKGSWVVVGGSPGLAAVGLPGASSIVRSWRANTRHSIRELLASRLAPCTPVQATSPTA